MYNDSLFNTLLRPFKVNSRAGISRAKYPESCRGDPMRYVNAAGRLFAPTGELQMINTAKDPRLGRIFLNGFIRPYPAFARLCGMEETIERILGFFRDAVLRREKRKPFEILVSVVEYPECGGWPCQTK